MADAILTSARAAEIISRQEAIKRGMTRYFTGVPCKRGHISTRLVGARVCVECKKLYEKENAASINERVRKRYAINKEYVKAYRRARYASDPQTFLAKAKARREKPGFVAWSASYLAQYYEENKQAIAEKRSSYNAKNREKRRALIVNRRARVKQVGGALSSDIVLRLLNLQKCKCANCKVSLRSSGHHVDHIMPIALGGTNSDDNVQLLCPRCNTRKSAKHPIEWARQQGRLL